MPPHAFGDVVATREVAPGRFVGELDPEWTIDGKPNGGYLLAMAAASSTWRRPHDHVLAASAQFLRSPEVGTIDVEVELLRTGASTSQSRVLMTQGKEVCVDAHLTSGRLDAATSPAWSRADAPSAAPLAECERLGPRTPDGRPVAILDQVDLWLDPATAGFTRGEPTGRGELRGWLGLPGGEPFDPTSLLYAVDAFPPATFDIESCGWVPTLALSAYVRALPAPGPVQVLQRAQLVEAGRVDELCLVWDVEGRLVAQATQLAAIRIRGTGSR